MASANKWIKHFENIKIMRKNKDAPVDLLGCHMLADSNCEPKNYRFQCLMALVLSPQTKDEVTAEAMDKLKTHGCSAETLKLTSIDQIQQLIYPVSFYKTKARHISLICDILLENYNGDIPPNFDSLCKLPGVGPKIGHLAMMCGWGVVTGIGVDTHVHRVSNRLAWVQTKSTEKTRIQLEELLPREYWMDVNQLLVGFGQTICTPVKPACASCLNQHICPSANAITVKKRKKLINKPNLNND